MIHLQNRPNPSGGVYEPGIIEIYHPPAIDPTYVSGELEDRQYIGVVDVVFGKDRNNGANISRKPISTINEYTDNPWVTVLHGFINEKFVDVRYVKKSSLNGLNFPFHEIRKARALRKLNKSLTNLALKEMSAGKI